MRSPVTATSVLRYQQGSATTAEDILVSEEPLEIRIGHGPLDDRREFRLSVTMRTPGHDDELALGFLFTEGIIRHPSEVVRIVPCTNVKEEERGNVVRAELRPDVVLDPDRWQRNFYTSSSCGVCGKTCAANELCISGVCSANCRVVGGIRWCYNPNKCGEACATLCASLGLPFTIDDATWFAAQDTTAECQALSTAFGLGGSISISSYTYACLEDNGNSPLNGLAGPLYCSSYSGCPAQHRTNMDSLGAACGSGGRRSICPCQ